MAADIFGNTMNPNFVVSAPAPQSQTKSNDKKSWITSLIPAAASIIGGIGGSLIAPGIGTAAGGATGGVLGKKLQDLITGKHSSLGSYLGEGALGSLGGLGDAVGAARGAGTALKAGEGIEGAAQALRFGSKGAEALKGAEGLSAAEKAITANAANTADTGAGLLSKVANKGTQMESRAGGFNVGQKVGGKALLPDDVKNLEKWLAEKGIGAGSAEKRLAAVSDIKSAAGKNISDIVSNSGATVTKTERNQLSAKILEDAGKVTGPGKAKALADAQTYIEDIKNADTPQKLLDLKRAADSNINFNAKSASVAPETQQVAKIVRGHLNDTLTNVVREIEPHNVDYSTASKLEELLAAGAKNPKGLKIPIFGTVGGGVKQATESAGGKILQKVGGAATEAPTTATGLVAQTAKNMAKAQVIPRIVQVAGSQTPPQDNTQATPALDANGQPITDAGTATDTTQPTPVDESAQIQQGLRAAALKALAAGDTKGLANITSIASMFAAQDKASASNLTKGQQTTVDNANQATSLLDTVFEQFATLGGGKGRVGGGVSGLLGKVGLNNKVNAYNQVRADAAIPLAQALSGSTRLPPPATLKIIEASMPNFTDNPEEAQRKIDLLKQRLAGKITAAGGTAQ